MTSLLYVFLGLIAGLLSGLVGIGGGVVIVPALVFLFGFSQKEAQGTTLALLIPPIGLLAAWTYYKAGYVNVKLALLIIVGFVVGSLFGARGAVSASNQLLERVFGIFLLAVALRMLLAPKF